LNNIVKRLRDIGIEQVENQSLPKIAVIGNQSAGKSSLIEAISQVKVPRAAGSCTKCPMEVILNSKDEADTQWEATISLRLIEDVPSEMRKLHFFARTTEREEIPKLLQRAQFAVLSVARNLPVSHFVNLSDRDCERLAQENRTRFSGNVVVLEISGAEVDVAFIDLPGIISNVLLSSLESDCSGRSENDI